MLYVADEVFMVGTATEVAPVRSVDRIQVGEGKAGPVTKRIQTRFMDILRGKAPDVYGWLDRAPRASAVTR
jgi:branched-chain amino acid aminotransferase